MLSLETEPTQSGSFKTKVAAAVAATAAIGIVAAVTLSSSASVMRQTTGLFNIPEDIKGHFSGGQITGEWTVQGKFHKFETATGDWQIDSKLTVEGPAMGGSETYTLVDNVLVMVPEYEGYDEYKMQCGHRDNLPAYAKWAEHLDNAKTLQESSMSEGLKQNINENCPAGSDAVVVVVEEREYIICADSTANTRAMYAFNENFSFQAVSREGMTVNIEHPAGWEALNCTVFDSSKTRAEAAQLGRMVDYGDDDRELRMSLERHREDRGRGGSSGGGGVVNNTPDQKSCAFYHGVGGDGRSWTGLQPLFEDYWGDGKIGKRCSNTNKYIETDSQKRGYNSLDYHKEICATLAHSDFRDASKSVIFTHSMGGLTTRRAFANGRCSWNGAYHQSQAPMSGSKAANFAQGACRFFSGIIVGHIIIWAFMAAYCANGYLAGAHAGYHSIYDRHPYFPKGGKTADSRLCGSQPTGTGGWVGIGLLAIQLFAGLERRNDWCIIRIPSCGWRGCRKGRCVLWWKCPYNDGMVSYSSCNAWKHSATSIERMGMNHADGTGRNGDRSGGASVDAWYRARSMLGHVQRPGQCTNCLTPNT